MFGSKLTCPQCSHIITPNTTRCPSCKKTIPKKYTERYIQAENRFWMVFLGGFAFFLVVPLLMVDVLGAKWTSIAIGAGIPISFFVAFIVKLITGTRRK